MREYVTEAKKLVRNGGYRSVVKNLSSVWEALGFDS
jgi:hypothetical protein